MNRYVLRYLGEGSAGGRSSTPQASQTVQRAGGRVIDDAHDMLLVEANAATGKAIEKLLPEWALSREVLTPVPSAPRPAVRTAAARKGRSKS
jgi:hypothetical protein